MKRSPSIRVLVVTLIGCAIGMASLLSACASFFPPAPAPNADAPRAQPAKATLTIDGQPITIHALPTGNVAVKDCHQVNCRDEDSSFPMRMLSIVSDDHFAPPMPVLSYVIEHPEGIFVVDPGGTEDFTNEDTWECDSFSGHVNRSIVQLDVRSGEALKERFEATNMALEEIKAVIITHMHVDHTDGLRHLPSTIPTYVGAGDLNAEDKIGATTCRNLAGRIPISVEPLVFGKEARPGDRAEAALGHGYALTEDQRLRVYPTPGHTPGSLSVRLSTDQGELWFIGDTAFDVEGLTSQETAGIHFDMPGVRAQQALMHSLYEDGHAIFPSHDWQAPARLRALAEVQR